jgi:hypothetical protein
LVSASALGAEGRRFESARPDKCRSGAVFRRIDTGNVGVEFWKSQPNPGDEELKQPLLSRNLVDVGEHVARISSVRLNARLRSHLAGQVRFATARGKRVKTAVSSTTRTTAAH